MSKDHLPTIDESLRLQLHEGQIGLPIGYEDRSTNLFVPADPHSDPSLSIARDWLTEGENLMVYIDRQVEVLKKRLPRLQLLARTEAPLLASAAVLPGIVLDTVYQPGAEKVWQRQAGVLIAPRRVLIFTAVLSRAMDPGFETFWSNWLASFSLAGPTPGKLH